MQYIITPKGAATPPSWMELAVLLNSLKGSSLTDVERALGLYVAGQQESRKRKDLSDETDCGFTLYPRKHRKRTRVMEQSWHTQADVQKKMGLVPGPKALMVSDLLMTEYGDKLLGMLKKTGGIINVFTGKLGVSSNQLLIDQTPEIVTIVYNAIVDCTARFGDGATVRAYAKKIPDMDPRKERARLIEKIFFGLEANAHTLWHVSAGDIQKAADLPWAGFSLSDRISSTEECLEKMLQLIQTHGREVTTANQQRMNREVQHTEDMETVRLGNLEQYCQNAIMFVQQLWDNKPSKLHDINPNDTEWIVRRASMPRATDWRLADASVDTTEILGTEALRKLVRFASAITTGVNTSIQWKRKDIDPHHYRYFSTRTLSDLYPMWAWHNRIRGAVHAVTDAPLSSRTAVVYDVSNSYDHVPDSFLKCIMSVSGIEGTSAERQVPADAEIGAHGARKTVDANTAMRNTRRQWIRSFTELSVPEALGGLRLQQLLLEEMRRDATFDPAKPEVFYRNTNPATVALFHRYYNVVLQQVMSGAVNMMMVRMAFAVGSNRKANSPDLLLLPIIWHLYFMVGVLYHCEQFLLRAVR